MSWKTPIRRTIRGTLGPATVRSLEFFIRRHGIPITENDRRISRLYNRHAGSPGFVIGNGPSLRAQDLERLTRHVSIASNRIYLIYKETNWRPTYYSLADTLLIQRESDRIVSFDMPVFTRKVNRKHFQDPGDVIFLDQLKDENRYQHGFSHNILEGLSIDRSVTQINLQIAYYLGLNPVYLIGIDHNYPHVEAPKQGNTTFVYTGGKNHFCDDYLKLNEEHKNPHFSAQDRDYRVAKAAYEAKGRQIINCTRGGKLEVFPRADFDQVCDELEAKSPKP